MKMDETMNAVAQAAETDAEAPCAEHEDAARGDVDRYVASLGVTDDDGNVITTQEALLEYVASQADGAVRAEGDCRDDENETADLRKELSAARIREQDAEMLRDPELGDAYASVREPVLGLVCRCREQGMTGVDVRAAFCSVLESDAGEIFRAVRAKAAADALRSAENMSRATPGRLSGGDAPAGNLYAGMSGAEFERHIALAKAGMLRKH